MSQEKDKKQGNFVYKELQPKVVSLYEDYNYLNLTIEQFEALCIDIMLEIYEENQEISNKKIIETLQISLEQYIKNELNNNEKYFKIIGKFIENKVRINEEPEKNIEELRKVNNFLTRYEVEQTPELSMELLKNSTINKIVENIITNNFKIINSVGFESIDSNHNIQLLLELYCESKEISFKGSNEILFTEEYNDEFKKTTDSFGLYLSQIAKPLLTKEEEQRLFILKDQGDEAAREKLIEHNLQLVVYVAKAYMGKGMDVLDLVQEGNLGLVTAIEKFDYKKGYKLSTYATWWIKQAIQRSIMNNAKPIRLPVHVCEKLNKYGVVVTALEKKLLRKPTQKEICEEMDITLVQLRELEKAAQNVISLNSILNPDGDRETELGDMIPSDEETLEEQYIQSTMSEEILHILDKIKLSANERFVLEQRNGFNDGKPKTLEEIAKMIGITRERVRQIETKALRKIRISPYIKRLASLAELPEEKITFLKIRSERYDQYINEKRKILKQTN